MSDQEKVQSVFSLHGLYRRLRLYQLRQLTQALGRTPIKVPNDDLRVHDG